MYPFQLETPFARTQELNQIRAELQSSREEQAQLLLEKSRLLSVLDQLKTSAVSARSLFEDRAVLECLADAVRDATSARQAEQLPVDLEVVRLNHLCRNQRRVISGLLQKQQGVFSDTAISQIWKIVELLGLQLKKATKEGPVPLEAATLAKEVKHLRDILNIINKKSETSDSTNQTDLVPPTYSDRASSPRPVPTRVDAFVSARPIPSIQQVTHFSKPPPRQLNVGTDPSGTSRAEASIQTAQRLLDRAVQTEKRVHCEVCAGRAERVKRLGVFASAVHVANFGTSEEILEAKRSAHAAKHTAKKLEDERNKLSLDLEDKKHKIGVISRRTKLLNEELKVVTNKQRDKENAMKDDMDKLNRTIAELKLKLKKSTEELKRREAPVEPMARRSIETDTFFRSVGSSQVLEVSPRLPSRVISRGRTESAETPSWRRIVGHLSEPEMATIRRSVEFVGLDGLKEVMNGLFD